MIEVIQEKWLDYFLAVLVTDVIPLRDNIRFYRKTRDKIVPKRVSVLKKNNLFENGQIST
jgi:hypothetical protein